MLLQRADDIRPYGETITAGTAAGRPYRCYVPAAARSAYEVVRSMLRVYSYEFAGSERDDMIALVTNCKL